MTLETPCHGTSSARARSSLTILALLVGLVALTQCVCQNGRRDAPPPAPAPAPARAPAVTAGDAEVALPARLDVKDLDEDERALLAEVLTGQFDPCGQPRSFLESLAAAETCELAEQMGAHTVLLVQRGLSKKQIIRELLEQLSRATSKVDFDLTDTPHYGDPASARVIVEFMDFECPFCRIASEPAKELAKRYGAVLYVKHLPLVEHHEHAEAAALAAIAADRQGRFWEVYKRLLDNQDRLVPDVIRAQVVEAGLDMARFDADVASESVKARLARDVADADRVEVEGTPMFYLDGYAVEFDQLEEKLRAE